ncbi:LysR family transcriptional regulator [Rhabdochromatium marinum]|uniref:LysR family transcriptional regulator n=1 Tax=Rhabdochromatium marinum TaxID=48729 RepID=UPI001908C1E4|nr:LysR family transcriptional regulator [Rhabdochromatium marinum]MBK1650144.1 LysR family transcriptional regulator [Rhabdochromatium marinum]
MTNLRTLDLNLLVVLRQLLEDRHVSRAGEQLGMSQPAVSRALQRLRAMFDDPLLVRTPRGFELSARAEALLPELSRWLNEAEHLVSRPVFDPATSTQVVRFYGPEPEVGWFLPPLFERMRQLAPGMVLEVNSEPRDHFGPLERGEVHFVVTPFEPSASTAQLHSLRLAPLNFALVMSKDNPLAQGPLTLERIAAASHGLVSLTGRGGGLLEKHLIEQGQLSPGERLNQPLRLSSFASIPAFCERSDIVFRLPRRFAKELARGRNLVVREAPLHTTKEVIYAHLYWHERFHKDPMCRWIREQLKAGQV